MIWLALGVMLLAPLVGVLLMEFGSPALNFAGLGHPNGATAAGAMFAVVLVLTAVVANRLALVCLPIKETQVPARFSREAFRRLGILVIAFNLMLLLFIIVVAGAWRVLAGQIGRGEFRSSLGGLGVFAFMARDFLAPMACASVAFVYRRCSPGWAEAIILGGAIVVTATGSMVWGYKASALFALLPAFVLLVPHVRFVVAIELVASAIVLVIATAMVFDDLTLSESGLVVLSRATIGAGDTPWKLWDLRNQGAFPPWLPTLLSGLGGRLATLLGSWTRTGTDWYSTDFTATASWVVKDYNATLQADMSNVTATAFGEGVFALGSPGYLVFAVVGGLVLAGIQVVLRIAERRHRTVMASVAANYFGFSYLSWINSGGLTTLLNIPHLISILLAAGTVTLLLVMAGVAPAHFRAPPYRTPKLQSEFLKPSPG